MPARPADDGARDLHAVEALRRWNARHRLGRVPLARLLDLHHADENRKGGNALRGQPVQLLARELGTLYGRPAPFAGLDGIARRNVHHSGTLAVLKSILRLGRAKGSASSWRCA